MILKQVLKLSYFKTQPERFFTDEKDTNAILFIICERCVMLGVFKCYFAIEFLKQIILKFV